jgi:hypothetical protein
MIFVPAAEDGGRGPCSLYFWLRRPSAPLQFKRVPETGSSVGRMRQERKLRLELQEAQTRIGVLCAERDAYLQQRDEAIGERNELLRQRDLQAERSARLAHRADLKSSRRPRVATRDRILMFPNLAETGGRTLADIVLRNFSPGELLTIDTSEVDECSTEAWSHQAVEKALGRMRQSELDELRVVWGGCCCHGNQPHFPKPYDCVTLLRDPSECVMSNGGPGGPLVKAAASSSNNLDRHQHRPPHLDNRMTRILGGVLSPDPVGPDGARENIPAVTEADFEMAAKNLDRFLVVGLEDQFDQTLLVLGAELGWSLSDLVYCPRNPPRPAAPDLPDHVRSEVLDRNRYDAALVERGRRHLADRIASYPGDFNNSLALFRWINMLFRKGASLEELRRMEFHALRP